MSATSVLPFTVPLTLTLFVAIFGVAIVFARRRRDRLAPPGEPLQTGADGVTVVPILAAEYRGGILGPRTRNSLGPKLSLEPQGLAFKVLRQDHWPWSQLTEVDAARGLMGPTLTFRTARGHLMVTVRDLDTGRQALAALPPAIPLSARAAALRATGAI